MQEKSPEIQSLVEPPLTRREYFAALAMQGLIPLASFGGLEPTTNQTIAIRATGIADALIAELSK